MFPRDVSGDVSCGNKEDLNFLLTVNFPLENLMTRITRGARIFSIPCVIILLSLMFFIFDLNLDKVN